MPNNNPTHPESETEMALVELALDLRNCWNHATGPLWSKIEPDLWALTHNPWVVLQTASRTKLNALESDGEFLKRIRELSERQRQTLKGRTWFRQEHSKSSLNAVAYFSMEFALSEALPVYSGGLGNVAGDQLKAASDLGVPLVAVGLLYQQGYFRQVIEGDGFDRFAPELIGRHLASYAEEQLGVDLQRLLALGRLNPDDRNESFNMADLAIRGSGAVNAVSRLHGEVSRRIFQPLFPRWPEAEVSVGYVTNGVHTPTWDSGAADTLWTEACGQERWRGGMETLGDDIRRVTDDELWQLRSRNRSELVRFVRERIATELARRGADTKVAPFIFDPDTLTLGFARRFATYKRPNLMLHDPERLIRILTNPDHPVQLVIAGKAHPQDEAGQAMVQAWIRFIQRPEVRRHAVFLSDYDLILAERLVQGADLWINTPRRPWEACGTSGMKVLVNGGLNLSELDGWWAEAYSPQVGWALGDGKEHGDNPEWDISEAEQLYDTLEKEVIPSFYERDQNKLPVKWIGRIRESMAQLTPRFSANRAVREYTEDYYLPAAAAFHERTSDGGALGGSLLKWKKQLTQNWTILRFGKLHIESSAESHALTLEVHFGELGPDLVRLEVYADAPKGESSFVSPMTLCNRVESSEEWWIYSANVPASRPASDYTPRIVPYHSGARAPHEDSHILWFR